MKKYAVGFVLLALLLSACSSNEPQPPPRWKAVSGSVSYRERMMLPPGAEIVVRLEDVSKMDVAAELRGETRFEARGGPPYSFGVKYDPDQIDPRMRYSLRASIFHHGELMFTSTEHIPAFEGDDPIAITVHRVGGSGREAVIEGKDWILADLAGADITQIERIPTLNLQPGDARVAGVAGCNRYFGSYTKSGRNISFGKMGVTMMACANGMETERAFLAMLEQASRWRMEDGLLLLSNTEGAELARFR